MEEVDNSVPSKSDILEAFKLDEYDPKRIEVFKRLAINSNGKDEQIYKCILCGYESPTTNVHRHCPKTPTTLEVISQSFCSYHKTFHSVEKNGFKVWTEHESVMMPNIKNIQKDKK